MPTKRKNLFFARQGGTKSKIKVILIFHAYVWPSKAKLFTNVRRSMGGVAPPRVFQRVWGGGAPPGIVLEPNVLKFSDSPRGSIPRFVLTVLSEAQDCNQQLLFLHAPLKWLRQGVPLAISLGSTWFSWGEPITIFNRKSYFGGLCRALCRMPCAGIWVPTQNCPQNNTFYSKTDPEIACLSLN